MTDVLNEYKKRGIAGVLGQMAGNVRTAARGGIEDLGIVYGGLQQGGTDTLHGIQAFGRDVATSYAASTPRLDSPAPALEPPPVTTEMEQRWRAMTRPGEQRLQSYMRPVAASPEQPSAASAPTSPASISAPSPSAYQAPQDRLGQPGAVQKAVPLGQPIGDALYSTGSQPAGTQLYANSGQPVTPVLSATSPIQVGGIDQTPLYRTAYTNAQGNEVLSITGPDRRVGGGTLSQPDQGNGGTVEGNVAALNRQYDAVKGLNDYWAGQRSGGSVGGSMGGGGSPRNPFELPGDSRLDTAVRQQTAEQGWARALDPHSGMTRSQRQMAIQAYQAAVAPGLTLAQGEALTPYQVGQLGIEQQRLGLDRQQLQVTQDAAAQQGILKNIDAETKRRILALNDRLATAKDDQERYDISRQIQQLSGHSPPLSRVQMIDVPNPDPQAALLQPTIKRPYDPLTNTILSPQLAAVSGQEQAQSQVDPAKLAAYQKLRQAGKSEDEALKAIQ